MTDDDNTDMTVDNYLIHSTFVHDALENWSIENDINIIEEIRRALKERTENEERGSEREPWNGNRGAKRSRSTSRGREALSEHDHQSNEKSQDERKMHQKLNRIRH